MQKLYRLDVSLYFFYSFYNECMYFILIKNVLLYGYKYNNIVFLEIFKSG